MAHLTKVEREIVINMNDEEDVAYIYTRQARIKSRLKKCGHVPVYTEKVDGFDKLEKYIVPRRCISIRGIVKRAVKK